MRGAILLLTLVTGAASAAAPEPGNLAGARQSGSSTVISDGATGDNLLTININSGQRGWTTISEPEMVSKVYWQCGDASPSLSRAGYEKPYQFPSPSGCFAGYKKAMQDWIEEDPNRIMGSCTTTQDKPETKELTCEYTTESREDRGWAPMTSSIKAFYHENQVEECSGEDFTMRGKGGNELCGPTKDWWRSMHIPDTSNGVSALVDGSDGTGEITKDPNGGVEIKEADGPLKKEVEPVNGNQAGVTATTKNGDGGTFSVIEWETNVDSSGTDVARVSEIDENGGLESQTTVNSWDHPDTDFGTEEQRTAVVPDWSNNGTPDWADGNLLGDGDVGGGGDPFADDDSGSTDSGTSDDGTTDGSSSGSGTTEVDVEVGDVEVDTPDEPYSWGGTDEGTGVSDLEDGLGEIPGGPAADGIAGPGDLGVSSDGCSAVEGSLMGKPFTFDYCKSADYIRTLLAWVLGALAAFAIWRDWFQRPG